MTGAGALVLAVVATSLVLRFPVVLGVIGATAACIVLVARGHGAQAAVGVLLVAFLCFRPMLFGEQNALVGVALLSLALLLCAGQIGHLNRVAVVAIVCSTALWMWQLLLLAVHPQLDPGGTLRGLVTVYLVVVLAGFVLSDERRRTWFVKGFLVILLAGSASAVVTAVIWQVVGVGTFHLAVLPHAGYRVNSIGEELVGVPVYLPFTTTYSALDLFGQVTPRFLGIGQESGVMGALCGVGVFLLPRVGWGRWRWRILLVAGLLLTQSTGGLGALLVGVVANFAVRHRSRSVASGYFKTVAAVGLLAVAAYLAISAPGIGVAAKQAVNEVSVGDRQSATIRGLQSALTYPFGQVLGPDKAANAGINTIASIAQIGLVGALLALAGILLPWLLGRSRRASIGSIAVLAVTVLIAQPLVFSTAFFVLAMLCSMRLPYDTDESPTRRRDGRRALPGDPRPAVPGLSTANSAVPEPSAIP